MSLVQEKPPSKNIYGITAKNIDQEAKYIRPEYFVE
jgi:hypothetical protein